MGQPIKTLMSLIRKMLLCIFESHSHFCTVLVWHPDTMYNNQVNDERLSLEPAKESSSLHCHLYPATRLTRNKLSFEYHWFDFMLRRPMNAGRGRNEIRINLRIRVIRLFIGREITELSFLELLYNSSTCFLLWLALGKESPRQNIRSGIFLRTGGPFLDPIKIFRMDPPKITPVPDSVPMWLLLVNWS